MVLRRIFGPAVEHFQRWRRLLTIRLGDEINASGPRREPQLRIGAVRAYMLQCSGRNVSRGTSKYVGEIVVDCVQMLRGGVDRSHLDHELVADDPIAERLLW